MWENFKDWKTTVPGLVAAFFAFVLFAPQYFDNFPIVKDIAAFATAGGLAFLGINSVSRLKKP